VAFDSLDDDDDDDYRLRISKRRVIINSRYRANSNGFILFCVGLIAF